MCLKATSQLRYYLNKPQVMKGCVRYPAGQLPFFPKETIIEADEPYPIPHAGLRDPRSLVGEMPADFHGRLVNAVKWSVTLSPQQRTTILMLIEAVGA